MRKIFIIVICAIALCCIAFAEEVTRPTATADINGKVFMGYLPIDDDGLPNANGSLMAPVYAAFSQIEDRFCCTLVTIAVDDDRAGLPEVLLAPFYGAEGTITNNNLEFTLEIDTGELKLSVPVKGAVQQNGNIPCQLFPPLSKPVPITFMPVNTGAKKYSGIYIGKIWIKGEAKPSVNNIGVALVVDGNSVSGTTIFYPPDAPEGELLDDVSGTLNQNTGAFSYTGEPPYNIEATGTIINGAFNVEAEAGGVTYVATANLMADTNWTNPNIGKKPKPKKLSQGKRTSVTINQTRCVLGGVPLITALKLKSSSLPSATEPAIFIERYSISAKKLELVFVVADDAQGTFKLEFFNPSGKSGLSKKFKFK